MADIPSNAVNNAADAAAGAAESTSKKLNIGPMSIIGLGLNVWGTVKDYQANREEGHGVISSIVRSGSSFAFGEFMGAKYIPYQMALMGYQLSKAQGAANKQAAERLYDKAGRLGGGYAPMSEAGYTMRQRSLNAIRQNGLNVQSVLGNEARMYYRST